MQSAIRNPQSAIPKYRIPALWDCWGFNGRRRRLGREVLVNPAEYAAAGLMWILAQSGAGDDRYVGTSLSRVRRVRRLAGGKVKDGSRTRRGGDWIVGQSMYGMMVRTTTAWDHDGDGRLTSRRYSELGTFLKSTLLLPLLKRMGVSVIYMMPVIKISRSFRKGELGCPYSAKNFFKLDPDQRDALLEDVDAEGQFGVFVECAHRLEMRVMIDVAPRTGARDHDWILEHPEWFYWIDRRLARSYQAPKLPGIDYLNPISGRLNEVYDNPGVRAHLKKFRFAPNVTVPRKWANFIKRAKAKPPADLLKEIGKHFGVITPPGFSDVINDTQPPWSDVTYLRLFLDHPVESAKHLPDPDQQPPYVLFDTAKASLF